MVSVRSGEAASAAIDEEASLRSGTIVSGDDRVVTGDEAVQTTDDNVRTIDETVSTPVLALDLATELLARALGPLVDADYVLGKTRFRDALCEQIEISQLEAEELVDDLERTGRVQFIGAIEGGGEGLAHRAR